MRRTWVALQRHDGIKQILIVLGAFAAYELARMFIQPNWSAAMANARKVDNLERALNFAWEQSVQQAFMRVPELIEAMNLFYFVGHFVLTGLFFLWLYHRSRDGYRSFRNGFLVETAIAVLLCITTNTITKIGMAFGTGSRRFGREVTIGLGIVLAVAWGTWSALRAVAP